MSDFWNSPLGVVLGFLAGSVPVWIVAWWLHRRDFRRWQQEAAERERRWELERQLRELEEQIREEQMSEEERAWHRRYRKRQAAITEEARRRLGLPEEEPPAC